MGQSGEGNQPIVGWCAPLAHPLRLGLETLGWGAPPLALGGTPPPWPPPPLGDPISRAGAPPPRGAYIYEGEGGGNRTLSPGASLSPATPLSLAV